MLAPRPTPDKPTFDKNRLNDILDSMSLLILEKGPNTRLHDKFNVYMEQMSIFINDERETRLDDLERIVSRMTEERRKVFDDNFDRMSTLMNETDEKSVRRAFTVMEQVSGQVKDQRSDRADLHKSILDLPQGDTRSGALDILNRLEVLDADEAHQLEQNEIDNPDLFVGRMTERRNLEAQLEEIQAGLVSENTVDASATPVVDASVTPVVDASATPVSAEHGSESRQEPPASKYDTPVNAEVPDSAMTAPESRQEPPASKYDTPVNAEVPDSAMTVPESRQDPPVSKYDTPVNAEVPDSAMTVSDSRQDPPTSKYDVPANADLPEHLGQRTVRRGFVAEKPGTDEIDSERKKSLGQYLQDISGKSGRTERKKIRALLDSLSIKAGRGSQNEFVEIERMLKSVNDKEKMRINEYINTLVADGRDGIFNSLRAMENLENLRRIKIRLDKENSISSDGERREPVMTRAPAVVAPTTGAAVSAQTAPNPDEHSAGDAQSVQPDSELSDGSIRRMDRDEFLREANAHDYHAAARDLGNSENSGSSIKRMDLDDFMREARAHQAESEQNTDADAEDGKDLSNWMKKPAIWPSFIDFPSHNDLETIRIAEAAGKLDDEMKKAFNAKYEEMSIRFKKRAEQMDAWIIDQNRNFGNEKKHLGMFKSYIRRDIDNLLAERDARAAVQDKLPEEQRNYDNPDPFCDIKWASLLNPSAPVQLQSVARWGHSTLRMQDNGVLKANDDSVYVPFGDAGSADAGKMAVMEAAERGWSTINISGSPEFVQAARQAAMERGLGAKITVHTGFSGKTRTEFLMPRLPGEEGVKTPVEEAKDAHEELSGEAGKAPKNGPDQPMIGNNEEQSFDRDSGQPANRSVAPDVEPVSPFPSASGQPVAPVVEPVTPFPDGYEPANYDQPMNQPAARNVEPVSSSRTEWADMDTDFSRGHGYHDGRGRNSRDEQNYYDQGYGYDYSDGREYGPNHDSEMGQIDHDETMTVSP